MIDRTLIVDAIEQSWSKDTSAVPDEWNADNPSRGQCDVSSFVLWELAGGNLVLAEVFIDGERSEHHYWNRLDSGDIDLTRGQFTNGEEIREKMVLPNDDIAANAPTMRHEQRIRIGALRDSVHRRLAAG